MKLNIIPLLALVPAVIAAPVPEAEASPGFNSYGKYGKYSGYGSYPPPKGGYSNYGTYKRAEDKVEKRDYADYGSYDTPKGGYGSYGDYAAVKVPADVPVAEPVPAPAAGYGDYGTYPEPAGGYGSYGSYKRSVLEFVKRVLN